VAAKRSGGGKRPQSLKYAAHHPIQVLRDLAVLKPEDGEAFLMQHGVANGVVLGGFSQAMLISVQFDRNPPLEAGEVEDVAAERRLPANVEALGA
jgi:hypothetical protein